MKKTVFEGAGVAIVTPMHEDGSVNYEKLAELVNYQIAHKTDAIIICGTTGESSTLTHEEHTKCIKVAVEAAAGRVPVIAGTGSNDTAYGIELSKEAERLGADALLLITPYYNKTTQKGLVAHFTAIAKAVDLPIILYNVPGRTGVNLLPETLLELSELDNIVAVKEASGNLSQVAKIAAICGDKLDIYSGNDDQIVPVMSLGGKGVISVLSNIAPEETHNIAMEYLHGSVKESLALQLKYLALVDAIFCEVNPIPVKCAMNYMGFGVGPLRLPLVEVSDAHEKLIKDELRAVGLL